MQQVRFKISLYLSITLCVSNGILHTVPPVSILPQNNIFMTMIFFFSVVNILFSDHCEFNWRNQISLQYREYGNINKEWNEAFSDLLVNEQ